MQSTALPPLRPSQVNDLAAFYQAGYTGVADLVAHFVAPLYPGKPEAPIPDGIEAQTRLVIENLGRVLGGLSLSLRDVVRAGAYLTHFAEDYATFNRIYQGYFETGRLPARTCIGVTALARGARVEIDFVARRRAFKI